MKETMLLNGIGIKILNIKERLLCIEKSGLQLLHC